MTTLTASPVSVEFHGTTIPTFNVDGVVRVAMKTICESIGLDWRGQRQRIMRHPVLSQGVVMITTPSKGGIQKALTLPLNKLNGWLFGIDTNRVKPEIREKLIDYQAECFDVLANYWQKRNPASTPMVKPPAAPVDSQWVEGHFNGQRIRAFVGLTRWEVCLEDCAAALGYRSPADLYKLTPGGMWLKLPPSMYAEAEDDPITLVGPTAILSALMRSQRKAAPALAEWLERELFFQRHIAAEATPASVRLEVPAHKTWDQYTDAELYGNDVMHHSRLGMMLQALKLAGTEGVSLTIGDISGAQAELTAYRHRLETHAKRNHALTNEQLQRVWLLCHHMGWINTIFREHKMYDALKALGSPAGVKMHDHLQGGVASAHALSRHFETEFNSIRGQLIPSG